MKSDNLLSSPDETGWYWFKKNIRDTPSIVFLDDDGVGRGMDEEGNTFLLDDTIGFWEKTESLEL